MDFLEGQGIHRYEIANFAKSGFKCRHNLAYWRRQDYLGLGLNASSLLSRDVRTRNYASMNFYRDAVERGTFPHEEKENLSDQEVMEEELFLSLRLVEGISLKSFEEKIWVQFFYKKRSNGQTFLKRPDYSGKRPAQDNK